MEKIYINLLDNHRRNYLRIFMGILMIATVTGYKIVIDNPNFSTTYLVLFLLAGLYYTILGTGINPLSIFLKAYISVDEDKIEFKQSAFSKKEEVQWSYINEISFNITGIRIKVKEDTIMLFEYKQLDAERIHKLKTTVIELAKSKNIKLS